MLLYFTNNSKQKKVLIETDYVEDIYDEIMAFFEDYKIRPHLIEIRNEESGCSIGWESQSEFFICEGASNDDIDVLKQMFG